VLSCRREAPVLHQCQTNDYQTLLKSSLKTTFRYCCVVTDKSHKRRELILVFKQFIYNYFRNLPYMESLLLAASSSSMPSSTSTNSYMGEAQRLNNTATSFMENGRYDRAIMCLERALQLWEAYRMLQTESVTQKVWYASRNCTLDRCIAFSEQQERFSHHYLKMHCDQKPHSRNANDTSSGSGNKRRRVSIHKSIISGTNNTECSYKRKQSHHIITNDHYVTEDNASDEGYTYTQPIRIPEPSNLGTTCFFVILFNLALTNHLKTIRRKHLSGTSVQAVVHLYELIFEYWRRIQADCSAQRESDTTTASLKYVMILLNNLSQLYKLQKNFTQQEKCLEQLLSIVMMAVESNSRVPATEQNNNDSQKQCQESFQKSIDGFLTNLMQPEQCAQAA